MFRRKTPDTGESDNSEPNLKAPGQTRPPATTPADINPLTRAKGVVPEIAQRPTDIGTPAAIRAAAAQARRPTENKARRPTENKTLVVGSEISLSGDITACDVLVVEGRVEATLENSDILEVMAGGSFKGRVAINNAVIAGEFEGDLLVREQLKVLSGGKIIGSVKYSSLVIEEGGLISGTMEHMEDGAASVS